MSSVERPNILIVITHDTGRHLGTYGRGVATPNLDRLAQEGVLFQQAFCTAPQCSPSRASLLAGRVPHSHGLIGLTHRGFRLAPDVPLLPALLASAGYRTYLFGFQHEAPDAHELGYQTVTRAEGERPHSCLNVTPLLVDFLEREGRAAGPPFFAVAGFSETHRPFPPCDDPPESVQPLPYLPDEPEIRRDVSALNVLVRRVDASAGQIMDALDRTGLAERTLLLFTTDHGIAFPGAKATLFDPGLEIALLARGPGGFAGGKQIGAMVSNADIMPTLLELCGVPVPPGVQGKSLLPLVRGEVERLHEELFVELTYHAAYDPMRGVRTERFKYIRSYEPRPFWFPPNVDPGPTKTLLLARGAFDRPRPREMLFDLAIDPLEQRNLADDPAGRPVLEEMRARLERWMRETGDPLLAGFVPLPPGARVTPIHAIDP